MKPITFDTPEALATALRASATAHHTYEQTTGARDDNWADWYAEWIFTTLFGREVAK